MAEGAGFEPAWGFPLTVFKFRTHSGVYWNIQDFLTLLWTTSKLGEGTNFKAIIPSKPHGIKERAASRENIGKWTTKWENGENLERTERKMREPVLS